MLADSLMPYIHNGQIGYKSTIDNRVYITPQYYWAGCFNEGLAPVSIKDITQKSIKKQKRAGCIDTLGEIVIPFEYCHVSAFNEDRAVVQSYWGYGNMCSYHSSVIDTEGKLIHIPVEFDSIDSYYERRAIIKKLDEESGYNMTGFIDQDGQIIVPLIYHNAYPFSGGVATVWKNGKAGAIDINGNLIIPLHYEIDRLGQFFEGLASIKGPNGKIGFLNSSGDLAIPYKFKSVSRFCNGLAYVSDGIKQGYINTNGEFVYSCPDYGNYLWPHFSEGYAPIELNFSSNNREFGIINELGELISTIKCDDCGVFHKGLAPAYTNGKIGFINYTGEFQIPPIFDKCLYGFEQGLASVKYKGKDSFVDFWGNIRQE